MRTKSTRLLGNNRILKVITRQGESERSFRETGNIPLPRKYLQNVNTDKLRFPPADLGKSETNTALILSNASRGRASPSGTLGADDSGRIPGRRSFYRSPNRPAHIKSANPRDPLITTIIPRGASNYSLQRTANNSGALDGGRARIIVSVRHSRVPRRNNSPKFTVGRGIGARREQKYKRRG